MANAMNNCVFTSNLEAVSAVIKDNEEIHALLEV